MTKYLPLLLAAGALAVVVWLVKSLMPRGSQAPTWGSGPAPGWTSPYQQYPEWARHGHAALDLFAGAKSLFS